MSVGNSAADRKAKTAPARLGRDEGVEDLCQDLFGNARAGIGHFHEQSCTPALGEVSYAQGKLAAGYKDIFASASFRDTGIADIRDLVREHIKSHSPVSAALDGRITNGASTAPVTTPAQLPNTGASTWPALATALLGAGILALGWQVRRRGRA